MAAGVRTSQTRARRGAMLIALSMALHAALLTAVAFHAPALGPMAEPRAMAVDLVPPPFVGPAILEAARPLQPMARRASAQIIPRHVPEAAPPGQAGDAVDLFGPVFADGLWPRPILVRDEACDPDPAREATRRCRGELLLIGLASDAPAGANAPP